MGKNEKSEYKCPDCKDSGFVKTVSANGTEGVVFCHCHPLVEKGRLKMWTGGYEYENYLKRKNARKKGYEVGD